MDQNKNIHDKAWDLLEQKGLKLGEKMMVRSAFVEWSGYKHENPFIDKTRKKGRVEYYHSTHDLIKHFMFKTENEVVLANAIYLNTNEMCNVNEFREMFKYTCKIIGLDSEWNSK